MARTRNILRRMRSVRNIRTVTKAMQTVSAARFKLAHDRIQSFTPYGVQLLRVVSDLVARGAAQGLEHALLNAPQGVTQEALLVITSRRGLCGPYNSGVLRLALQRREQLRKAGHEVLLHVVGARGVRYFQFRHIALQQVHPTPGEPPDFASAAEMAGLFMGQFRARQIGGLEVAYMQFASVSRQRPAIAQVLPVSELGAQPPAESELPAAYEFLPDAPTILRRLLPQTVKLKLYQCFLDAAASEQFMRRASMQAATENADEMAHRLKVRANRLRQRQITTELAEIMGGRQGLEND